MVHEYWLYYLDGLHVAEPSVHISIPVVYYTMHNIRLGGLDQRIDWYGCKLRTNIYYRYNRNYKNGTIIMRTNQTNEAYVGKQYWTPTVNDKIIMEITDLSNVNGDSWVTFKNVKTRQFYNCRLEAFEARYAALPD